ncbi:Mor transcription activator family protein [Pseudacidovorax sp. NFM-22]|uniref:Mor transcription activator family protein n=1 Tax=Pseudacidovorax sp. NFM-22 TaxID=2744469 RepID=UPI00351D593A
MNTPDHAQECPLSIIADEARNVAICCGAQWSPGATADLMRRLAACLGGMEIYIPRESAAERLTRHEKIRNRFNGRNVRELAKEFGISERTIRRILRASD